MKNQPLVSRRTILKTLGGFTLSAPLMGLLRPEYVQAAGSIKRFIIIKANDFATTPDARAKMQGNNLNLLFPNSTIAGLEEVKTKCLFVEGIGLNFHLENSLYLIGPGHASEKMFSTGLLPQTLDTDGNSGLAGGPSIDTVLAKRIASGISPHKLLTVCPPGVETFITRTESGAQGSCLINPQEIWSRYFADHAVTQTANAQSNSSADAAVLQERQAQKNLLRQQILNAHSAELVTLQKRLHKSARLRLEEHLAALNTLSNSLRSNPPEQDIFTPPPKPQNVLWENGATIKSNEWWAAWRLQKSGNYEDFLDKQMAMIVEVLACDLTRVVAWTVDHASGIPAGVNATSDAFYHTEVAHGYNPSITNNTSAQNQRAANAWTMKKIGQFLKKLDQRQDADGRSILDNSLVLITNNHGLPGSHFTGNLPMIFAGGVGAEAKTMKMGRAVNLMKGAADMQQPRDYWTNLSLMRSINHGYVTILNSFGLPDQSFGDHRYQGPLPGLL